ncbi:hypothetical protein GCM10007276_05950 [Agaricicola taiwanensis]|uniref:Uncharacterized protein n=1 Tax=Agaricicola taiwanensis TaxID=591372 RepID=A0A8J2VJ52_9RHOB|nr:hypothetical protein [Agaricicola taiwanensis]GGE31573.1 hypothetical protein GCM10007276_05950 [Agaricicola taiwanensis]
MSEADRRRELAGNVNDLDAAMAFLASDQAKCGQMGERDVKSFVARMPPEFSVSFVSMTAAVLVASDLFRLVSDRATIRLPKTIFQFKNLLMAGTATSRRDGCPYCEGRRIGGDADLVKVHAS